MKRKAPVANGARKSRKKIKTEAAVRIQRSWRRAAAIKNAADPIVLTDLRHVPRRFTIVFHESASCSYRFAAWPLLMHTMITADFRHPVTRRALNGIEVNRLRRFARQAGAQADLLFGATHALQSNIQRFRIDRESIVEYLLDTVHGTFQTTVRLCQDDDNTADDVQEQLDYYEESMGDLWSKNSTQAHTALLKHARLLLAVRSDCHEPLWTMVNIFVNVLLSFYVPQPNTWQLEKPLLPFLVSLLKT